MPDRAAPHGPESDSYRSGPTWRRAVLRYRRRIIIGRLLSKQVLCKPFGRWSGGGFEILHVGVKMATGQRHETLRLKRPLIGSQGQVSDREGITKRNHHHQRRRANKGGITSGLVLGEHLDRAKGNLILPGGRTAATSLGEPFPAVWCR